MPSSRRLIASNTLGSSAASVTFSSIPSTYTDLVLKYSARTDAATTNRDVRLRFNGITTTTHSNTYLRATNATASSGRLSNAAYIELNNSIPGTTLTANSFSSNEIYIPSYQVSQNKPIGYYGVTESNNAIDDYNYLNAIAGLWRNTDAITSIELYLLSGNYVSGSSFFLYGISNS